MYIFDVCTSFCDQEAQKVPEDVTKGYFVIQGRDFIRKSVLQVNEISEARPSGAGTLGVSPP